MALEIVPSPRGLAWRRRFGEFAFDTRQRPVGARSFWERVGAAELRFDLRAEEGVVIYDYRSTVLCLGPLRVPLPSHLGPRVNGRESLGSRPGRVRFEVTAWWLGSTVARYAGELELLESDEEVGR